MGARAGAEERPRRRRASPGCRRACAPSGCAASSSPRTTTTAPPSCCARPPSPARPTASPLRLALQAGGADRLRVRILKRRGPPLEAPLQLDLPPVLSAAARRRARRARASAARGAARGRPSSISPDAVLRRRRCALPSRRLAASSSASPCSGSRCTCRCSRSNRSRRPWSAPSGDAGAEPAIALRRRAPHLSANAAAQAQGVKPGLKRATALALAPQHRPRPGRSGARRRGAAAGRARGARLHAAASRCSRRCEPGAAADTVLLEVQASLRYFGGLDRLLQRAATRRSRRSATRVQHRQRGDGAGRGDPRPRRAAAALPRPRRRRGRRSPAAPVWLLGPGREHWEALQGMGLRQLGDLLGLPRAGLARRFGEALLAELDARLRPPRPIRASRSSCAPSFESRLELFARADTTEQVLHGASVLLERLVAWLAAQHAFVRRFRLLMHHETRWQQGDRTPQATALEIALAEPSRDSAHLLVLLRERLAQAAAAGADARARAAGRGHRQARRAEQRAVPDPAERGRRPDAPDRAAAGAPRRRPGAAPRRASRTIGPSGRAGCSGRARRAAGARVAARRPGAARAPIADARQREPAAASARPVWLQAAPSRCRAALAAAARRPAAQLLVGPRADRGRLVGRRLAERDYFIAEAADGALVWIYRARLPLSAAREAELRERLVPARPLRLSRRAAEASCLQRRSSPISVKPRRRSESLSQRLPLTPQNSM